VIHLIIRWKGYVGEMRNVCQRLIGKHLRKKLIGDMAIDGTIILKWKLEKKCWLMVG
jgi:hypothetical protein